MTEQPEERRELTMEETEQLIGQLAQKLSGEKFDIWLLISRGGLSVGNMLAQLLKFYNITVFSLRWYDDQNQKMEHPQVLQFPDEALLRDMRVLIIDDVWHTGDTICLARKKVIRAGGKPTIATLHYKPLQSTNDGQSDFYIEETDEWIEYPWETIVRRVM
ncbi:MAG: phosphoribosyltransferase family protein [Patescibacteria group bacterium]